MNGEGDVGWVISVCVVRALDPVTGVGKHEARIPDELAAALHRLASEFAVPLSSVLLTAHAKMLGALSGERSVCTGYASAQLHLP